MSLSSGLHWNTIGDVRRARAEYNYTAAQDDELSLRQGEILTCINKVDLGWWRVTNALGMTGLVPGNYLQELTNVPPPLPARTPARTTPSEYRYAKIELLDGTPYIRLLEILPGEQWSGSFLSVFAASPGQPHPLRCRLIHVPLRDPMPEYDALSYFWGRPDDQVTIECSDAYQTGTLCITRNLYTALIAIRNRSAGISSYVWADGICMNQTKEEKNQQVPLMTQIYSKAVRVVVWLGEEQSETLPAVQAISKCANAHLTRPNVTVTTMTMLEWMLLGFQNQEEAKYQIRAFYKLLSRPWFGRVWVIQEFAMAKSLLFLCGQYEIQEAQLMNGSAWLASSGTDSVVAPWGSNCMFLLHGIRSELQCHVRQPLLHLLASFRHRHATIPKDKIYAIYSLASDGGSENGCLNIQVDYDKTEKEEAFKSLAISFLIRDQNLDIVSLAGLYEPLEPPLSMMPAGTKAYQRCRNLPSWVPDWCSPDSTVSIPLFELKKPCPDHRATGTPWYTFPSDLPPTEFQACRNTSYMLSLTDADGLIVRGMHLATIRAIGPNNLDITVVPDQNSWQIEPPEHQTMELPYSHLARLCQWVDLIGADSNRTYFTGETMLDVFWQTMRIGHFPHGFLRERQQFYDWYTQIRGFMGIVRTYGHDRSLRDQATVAYNNQLLMMGAGAAPRTNFTARTNYVTGNRAMFVAEGEGRQYVGMAVRGSVVGDQLVIFEGGKVPFVARRSCSNEWVVVGACYVHGCMKGEVWDGRRCEEMVLV